MELEKVLLIGGSGFVGGWIASRLSERGVRVTIPTRHRDNTKQLIMLPTVDMVEANVNDPQQLAALMQGQDAVINLVGILHDHDSRLPYGKGFAAAHVELPTQDRRRDEAERRPPPGAHERAQGGDQRAFRIPLFERRGRSLSTQLPWVSWRSRSSVPR